MIIVLTFSNPAPALVHSKIDEKHSGDEDEAYQDAIFFKYSNSTKESNSKYFLVQGTG